MKWKINKLEIRNFKAFEQINFNFDCATLLTLEGPNGFGKTTVYDALELAFTGKIERISRLCNEIMLSAQKNYADNLFWNNKFSEEDILIKLELINSDNNEKLVFSRKAFVEDLKIIQNNKANNFDIFKMFLMTDFEDNNFKNEISQADLEKKLGDSFFDNYNVVNYLEQGQNQFIYSKSIKERKDSIKKLINTEEISKIIKNCHEAEKKITRKINVSNLAQRMVNLESKIKEIHMLNLNVDSNVLYKKISTSGVIPLWDMEFFSFFENETTVNEVDIVYSKLLDIFDDFENFTIKVNNKKIDDFIKKYSSHLKVIVKIGQNINDYESMKTTSIYYNNLTKAISYLSEDLSEITKKMLEEIKDLLLLDIDLFVNNNALIKLKKEKLFLSNNEILEINNARQKLINLHLHSDEKKCLLCDSFFDTHEILISALETKTSYLNASNDKILKEIKSLEDVQNLIINEERKKIEKIIIDIAFNKDLFNELEANKAILPSLDKIIKWLHSKEIENTDYDFILLDSIVEQRYTNLIESILRKKEQVDSDFSADLICIFENSFEKIDDVLLLNRSTIVDKFNYYKIKKNEFKNKQVLSLRAEISKIEKMKNACNNLKDKIKNLKSELTTLENAYSKKIISEIELTFHIYSGRLIQNYQRGLGIFIDEGDGDRLRFCTAEKSAHDAILAMSSGQLSALSLAFFLSLNRVYANSPFILIDDPAQSLDDINIASLSDLLRCELKDRQLFLSSHEDDISAYLRFRFKRVGLSQKPFNIQKINVNQ